MDGRRKMDTLPHAFGINLLKQLALNSLNVKHGTNGESSNIKRLKRAIARYPLHVKTSSAWPATRRLNTMASKTLRLNSRNKAVAEGIRRSRAESDARSILYYRKVGSTELITN